jgi:hypothetical protein
MTKDDGQNITTYLELMSEIWPKDELIPELKILSSNFDVETGTYTCTIQLPNPIQYLYIPSIQLDWPTDLCPQCGQKH